MKMIEQHRDSIAHFYDKLDHVCKKRANFKHGKNALMELLKIDFDKITTMLATDVQTVHKLLEATRAKKQAEIDRMNAEVFTDSASDQSSDNDPVKFNQARPDLEEEKEMPAIPKKRQRSNESDSCTEN